MATVHLYMRTQVVGEVATVSKIKALAEGLGKAVTEAGGDAGSVAVVDDPLEEEAVVTPAAANARAEGRAKAGR